MSVHSITSRIGANLVRERALRYGYSPLTVAAVVRTFKPDLSLPVAQQARLHVRAPDQSATLSGAA